MKLIQKISEVAELDEKETEILKHILNYVFHRLRNHSKTIPFLDIEDIDKMRRDLKII